MCAMKMKVEEEEEELEKKDGRVKKIFVKGRIL